MKEKIAIVLSILLLVSCMACSKKEEPAKVAVPNPMVQTDANGINEKFGTTFGVPADATEVDYYIINDKLAEMNFKCYELECTARIKQTSEFTDISGMYYEFEIEGEAIIGGNDAKLYRHLDGENSVDLCLCFDKTSGLMYSISVVGDIDGFDITALAEEIF